MVRNPLLENDLDDCCEERARRTRGSKITLTHDKRRRLLSPDLPPRRHIRSLAEQYFANVHPIRCFAFVHKPSFMRQLDTGFTLDDDMALLYVMCAHGAKYGTPPAFISHHD